MVVLYCYWTDAVTAPSPAKAATTGCGSTVEIAVNAVCVVTVTAVTVTLLPVVLVQVLSLLSRITHDHCDSHCLSHIVTTVTVWWWLVSGDWWLVSELLRLTHWCLTHDSGTPILQCESLFFQCVWHMVTLVDTVSPNLFCVSDTFSFGWFSFCLLTPKVSHAAVSPTVTTSRI